MSTVAIVGCPKEFYAVIKLTADIKFHIPAACPDSFDIHRQRTYPTLRESLRNPKLRKGKR